MRVLKQSTQKKPQCLPQISQIYADKQQNSLYLKQTVFLCVIMQLAAFLCVICVICGRINTQAYSINPHRRNPKCLSLIYADKTQNNKTALTSPICLSLRNNAACCIPLRDLRNLRENNTEEDSINQQETK